MVEVINNKISGFDWYLRMHPIAFHELHNNFYRLPLKYVFTLSSMRLNTASHKEEIETHLSMNIGDQIYIRYMYPNLDQLHQPNNPYKIIFCTFFDLSERMRSAQF
jgi:hypothetical protein